MPIPYFGRIEFAWCTQCNVPLILSKKCSICGTKADKIPLTPPGEVRPLFPEMVFSFRSIVDKIYGYGTGILMLPENQIILLNRVSAPDRMDELIVNGHVLGKFIFMPERDDWTFYLTLFGAQFLLENVPDLRKIVVIDPDAVPYIRKGANIMGPGILDADKKIQIGDDVIGITPDRQVICLGPSRMGGKELSTKPRGIGVKNRKKAKTPLDITSFSSLSNSWDLAVKANSNVLTQYESQAVAFIKRSVQRYSISATVAFSGGKDSLVTLLLTLKALGSENTHLFFADTGIEFPETDPFIHEIAKKYGILDNLTIESVGDRFWDDLETFGPPARDYRWCCKTCKLAPINIGIQKHYPGGVLTFVGQRRYESRQRSQERQINTNPWIPEQVRALPIQNWPALLIWLYIMQEQAPIHPLYKIGYERIGCWLCPANKMADFKLLEKKHPHLLEKWNTALETYKQQNQLPESWIKYGLWRWKKPSKALQQHLEHIGVPLPDYSSTVSTINNDTKITVTAGISPCRQGGVMLEGKISQIRDTKNLVNILNILGKTQYSSELGATRIEYTNIQNTTAQIFSDDSFTIRSPTKALIEQAGQALFQIFIRHNHCTGCRICEQQCSNNAIQIEHNQITINPDRCVQCMECLGYCPLLLNRSFTFT